MKLKQTNKKATQTPKKFTRIILTEDAVDMHKLVETKEGNTEYRMGIGKISKLNERKLRTITRTIVVAAKAHKLEYIAIDLKDSILSKIKFKKADWIASCLAENLLLADYQHLAYKTKKSKYTFKEVLLCGIVEKKTRDAVLKGTTLAEYTNKCRDISNTPGGDMTPSLLAKAAKTLVKGTKVSVKVLGEREIKKLKMGGIIAVGKGAKDKPKFIIMEYYGAGKPTKNSPANKKPIVLVGKGVTFDTGGLQIKPGMAMYEMHMDMSGGASVMSAIACAAKLKIKKNIVALIPAVENAVYDDAMRPGDIYTAMNGKTVEVLHTDAEGRLILGDALTYAKKFNPKLVVDVATLTGASLVAMGQHASVIMTEDRKLEDKMRDLGEESGDYVHPLPLWDEYKQYNKGTHGDISNVSSGKPGHAGTITAGTFLSHFADDMRWVHIDMAPRMTSIPSDKLAKGATGEPTRLLVKITESI